MNCKHCGGILSHFITTVGGGRVYRCSQGLTRHNAKHPSYVYKIAPCGRLYTQDYKELKVGDGVAYWSDGEVKVFVVKL